MISPEIQQYVQQQIAAAQRRSLYSTKNVANHIHNGIDAPKLPLASTEAGVTQLIAGSNITLSPSGGTGVVEITSTATTGVSSVTASGSGITASPTTGAVVVANTGVTSAIAGSGITVSGATGAVTFSASGGGGNLAEADGSDTASMTSSTQVTHTITHGLGVAPKLIYAASSFSAIPPSGSNSNLGATSGDIILDGSGTVIGGAYFAVFTGSPSGSMTYSGSGAATGNIVGKSLTSGGTGTSSVALDNVTSTTFDIVYNSTNASGGNPQNFSVYWYVLG